MTYDAGTGLVNGISGLDVAGTLYDMTIRAGSYDTIFAAGAPTFFGDSVLASAVADAIMAEMNAEPVVPTMARTGSEVLWVPFELPSAANFLAAQVGHDVITDPWRRFGNFFGSRSTDWSTNRWFFATFTASVPEPGTLGLLVLGMLGAALARRRGAA